MIILYVFMLVGLFTFIGCDEDTQPQETSTTSPAENNNSSNLEVDIDLDEGSFKLKKQDKGSDVNIGIEAK